MKRRISEIAVDRLRELDEFVRRVWDSAAPEVISASIQSIPRRRSAKDEAGGVAPKEL
jgi:hypothetical protein